MLNVVERPDNVSADDEEHFIELIETLIADAVNLGEAITVSFHKKINPEGDDKDDHVWDDEAECPCGTIEMIIPADRWINPYTILNEYYRKLQWLN